MIVKYLNITNRYYYIMNNRCSFCKKKVKFLDDDGYMETKDGLYHFSCVKKAGYQDFCKKYVYVPYKEEELKKENKSIS